MQKISDIIVIYYWHILPTTTLHIFTHNICYVFKMRCNNVREKNSKLQCFNLLCYMPKCTQEYVTNSKKIIKSLLLLWIYQLSSIQLKVLTFYLIGTCIVYAVPKNEIPYDFLVTQVSKNLLKNPKHIHKLIL